ncbi:GNAT family N-acetyltransferase [Stackebrandtia soli]|uniref:GNAT family N-acetyltransferase n=1 Tax=Stackebrandtia soli TaxID=1892856 RepID=UPI0039E8A0B8
MSVDIRGYRPADHPHCRDLWVELVEEHRRLYADGGFGGADPGAGFEDYVTRLNLSGLWVAVTDADLIVGMTGLLIDGRHGEVDPLVVAEPMRESGIGTLLLERVTEEARRRELQYLSMRPFTRNVAGLRTLHDAGFTNLSRVTVTRPLAETGPEPLAGIRLHDLDFDY